MTGQGWLEDLQSVKRQFRGVGGRLGVAFLTIASGGCLIIYYIMGG